MVHGLHMVLPAPRGQPRPLRNAVRSVPCLLTFFSDQFPALFPPTAFTSIEHYRKRPTTSICSLSQRRKDPSSLRSHAKLSVLGHQRVSPPIGGERPDWLWIQRRMLGEQLAACPSLASAGVPHISFSSFGSTNTHFLADLLSNGEFRPRAHQPSRLYFLAISPLLSFSLSADNLFQGGVRQIVGSSAARFPDSSSGGAWFKSFRLQIFAMGARIFFLELPARFPRQDFCQFKFFLKG